MNTKNKAFSLVEMIGVLAIMSIIASALVPVFIKQLDYMASEKESVQLKLFGDTFRQSVLKTQIIPNTGWESMIATSLGINTNQVLFNDRMNRRVYLIDPSCRVNPNVNLPYNQNVSPFCSHVYDLFGYLILPNNPRMIILSSISQPIPTNIVSGITSTNTFNSLWDLPNNSIPTGWNWKGTGDDLKIQRINLSDLFVRLILNNTSTNSAQYLIGTNVLSLAPNYTNDNYYLDGTVITLVDPIAANFKYTEILHFDSSFDFVLGSWRGEKFLGQSVHKVDGIDLQIAVNAFLNCNPNPYRKQMNETNQTVVNSMMNYMTNFCFWGWYSQPPYGSAKYLSDVQSAQNDLANSACGKGTSGNLVGN